jgi:hypothetical protein
MIWLFDWQKYIEIVKTRVVGWVKGVSLPSFLLSMTVLVSMVNKETTIEGLNGIVFHVSMWWVTNNIKFDLYLVIKIFGHTTWDLKIIYTKSYLMNWKKFKKRLKLITQNNIC